MKSEHRARLGVLIAAQARADAEAVQGAARKMPDDLDERRGDLRQDVQQHAYTGRAPPGQSSRPLPLAGRRRASHGKARQNRAKRAWICGSRRRPEPTAQAQTSTAPPKCYIEFDGAKDPDAIPWYHAWQHVFRTLRIVARGKVRGIRSTLHLSPADDALVDVEDAQQSRIRRKRQLTTRGYGFVMPRGSRPVARSFEQALQIRLPGRPKQEQAGTKKRPTVKRAAKRSGRGKR